MPPADPHFAEQPLLSPLGTTLQRYFDDLSSHLPPPHRSGRIIPVQRTPSRPPAEKPVAADSTQSLPLRQAPRPAHIPTAPYRNFLILAPNPPPFDGTQGPPGDAITALAIRLLDQGFVYVARSNQHSMEDDPLGVRYLPLHVPLPSFAILTAVFAVSDLAWARIAAQTYPNADVFLVEVPGPQAMPTRLPPAAAHPRNHPELTSAAG